MFKLRKKIIFLFLAISLIAGFSFISFRANAADSEYDKTQSEYDKTEKELQKKTVNLNNLQNANQAVSSQINTTAGLINKTETEIERKEAELENLKSRIELNKKIMIAYAQEMYYSDQEADWVLILSDKKFSDYFENFDGMLSAKEKLIGIIGEIKEDKNSIENVKEELAEKKEEHEDLLVAKQAEKSEISQNIAITQKTISELQAKLSKLRSALSSFLGKSFNTKDLAEAIKFASKKTGVRKEFLFAMLDKESDLGRFTGGCTYQNTKVKPADKEVFKDICEELNYNYKKQKISCAASWGGYGGAMGIAQFMPTTWIGYKSAISSYTGHNPPDPWNLADGVVGMAEKLKRAGAASKSKEHYAAKVYYCGGPSSAYWKTKCEAYADTVIDWSEGYDEFF